MTSPSGPQTPDELRAEIERTRTELGSTVDALSEKLDVKAQAKHRVDAAKTSVSDATHKAVAAAPLPVQEALGKAQAAAAPAIDKARPYRTQIWVGVGALLLAIMVLRRRKDS